METLNSLCDSLARILGGKGEFNNGICMVTVHRNDINSTLAGRSFKSLDHMFHFESPDANGDYLITGEMVLLEKEVPAIVTALLNSNIIVSAIHSHWLYDIPKLMYIHIEAISNPVTFSNMVAQLLKTL